MLSVSIVITVLYVILILLFCIGAKRLPYFKWKERTSKINFSVIIPFRNEAENLEELLDSIEAINYPKDNFEVLLIDDASEDNSVEIIERFKKLSTLNLTILKSEEKSESPKKEAIQLGITVAQNNWIITTDADCLVPENWLNAINSFIQEKNPEMIVAPVFLTNPTNSLLETTEILSLQTVTMGSFGLGKPIMNNGANLAFEKSSFLEVEGYTGNTHIASGDDLFLMEKFKKENKRISYLKTRDAIVFTKPQMALQAFVQQRVRWASKTSASQNLFLKFTGLVILLMNLLLVVLLIFVLFQEYASLHLLAVFLMKLAVDFCLVYSGVDFFKVCIHFFRLTILSTVYPFLHVYIGFKSILGGYQWKDRAFTR